MIYACNQLLGSLRAIDLDELAAANAANASGQSVVWDVPRPRGAAQEVAP